MGRNKKIIHGVLLLLALTVSPAVAANDPACIAYAYTMAESEPHASLLIDRGYVFGTQIMVVSNCNNTSIMIDGFMAASSPSGSLYTYVDPGEHTIILLNDGFNQTINNVTFIQTGQLASIVQQLPNEHNPYAEPWTPEEISNLELYSGIGALVLSWVMVVGVMWRLISSYQERNYIEEVL